MNEEMKLLYLELGSVHKVGKILGVSHSTVHRAVKKAGIRMKGEKFTQYEDDVIIEYYTETHHLDFELDQLADALKRPKNSVCTRAKHLGLTQVNRKMSASHAKKNGDTHKKIWAEKGHPKGMQGKKHTQEVKELIGGKSKANWDKWKETGTGGMSETKLQNSSDLMVAKWKTGTYKAEKMYSRAKAGKREDIGDFYFRSSWEANFARYLNLMKESGIVLDWEYESETFWFEEIKRGVRSYKPDFKVIMAGHSKATYYEIKGYMDKKSITKIKRMAKYYPEIDLKVVAKDEYKQIEELFSKQIENWETPK